MQDSEQGRSKVCCQQPVPQANIATVPLQHPLPPPPPHDKQANGRHWRQQTLEVLMKGLAPHFSYQSRPPPLPLDGQASGNRGSHEGRRWFPCHTLPPLTCPVDWSRGRRLEVVVATRGMKKTTTSLHCHLCCRLLAHMWEGNGNRGDRVFLYHPRLVRKRPFFTATLGTGHPRQSPRSA